MRTMSLRKVAIFSLFTVVGLMAGGCGNAAKGPDSAKTATQDADACAVAGWCTEHGVPEDICALCNAKLAAEYQQKGDWCKEHTRPESQCFLCNPKLADKFVAEYEAKYGKKPPKPQEK